MLQPPLPPWPVAPGRPVNAASGQRVHCTGAAARAPAAGDSRSPQATAHRQGVISSVVEENSGSPRSFNDFRSSGGMRTLIYAATRAEDPQGTRSFHRRTTEPTGRSSALRLISFTQDEFLKL